MCNGRLLRRDVNAGFIADGIHCRPVITHTYARARTQIAYTLKRTAVFAVVGISRPRANFAYQIIAGNARAIRGYGRTYLA